MATAPESNVRRQGISPPRVDGNERAPSPADIAKDPSDANVRPFLQKDAEGDEILNIVNDHELQKVKDAKDPAAAAATDAVEAAAVAAARSKYPTDLKVQQEAAAKMMDGETYTRCPPKYQTTTKHNAPNQDYNQMYWDEAYDLNGDKPEPTLSEMKEAIEVVESSVGDTEAFIIERIDVAEKRIKDTMKKHVSDLATFIAQMELRLKSVISDKDGRPCAANIMTQNSQQGTKPKEKRVHFAEEDQLKVIADTFGVELDNQLAEKNKVCIERQNLVEKPEVDYSGKYYPKFRKELLQLKEFLRAETVTKDAPDTDAQLTNEGQSSTRLMRKVMMALLDIGDTAYENKERVKYYDFEYSEFKPGTIMTQLDALVDTISSLSAGGVPHDDNKVRLLNQEVAALNAKNQALEVRLMNLEQEILMLNQTINVHVLDKMENSLTFDDFGTDAQ